MSYNKFRENDKLRVKALVLARSPPFPPSAQASSCIPHYWYTTHSFCVFGFSIFFIVFPYLVFVLGTSCFCTGDFLFPTFLVLRSGWRMSRLSRELADSAVGRGETVTSRIEALSTFEQCSVFSRWPWHRRPFPVNCIVRIEVGRYQRNTEDEDSFCLADAHEFCVFTCSVVSLHNFDAENMGLYVSRLSVCTNFMGYGDFNLRHKVDWLVPHHVIRQFLQHALLMFAGETIVLSQNVFLQQRCTFTCVLT